MNSPWGIKKAWICKEYKERLR